MAANGKKGITVKVDEQLHAEVTQYLQSHGMTMTEFVAMSLQDELHPKYNMKEGKTMGNMKTLAFQVPEDFFQRIKDYLYRNHMTQKDFVIGLIERELERDLAERQDTSEAMDNAENEKIADEEHSDTEAEVMENTEEAPSPEDPDEDVLAEEDSQSEELESDFEEEPEDDMEMPAEEEQEDVLGEAGGEYLDDSQEGNAEETEKESEDEDEGFGMSLGM